MKKNTIIIGGILIALLIVAMWAYLFIYGTPKSASEIFARFGMQNSSSTQSETHTDSTVDVSKNNVDTTPQRLKQLTTRPVAGAAFASSSILYVEQGTGHIYSINLTSGVETLLGGTTIPRASRAYFSQNGTFVAITALTTKGLETFVSTVPTNSNDTTKDGGITLPVGATEIQFGTATGTIQYLVKDANGSKGFVYSLLKKTNTLLFSIPLRDVHVLWGSPLYVYTTPSVTQIGHVYKIEKNELTYVAEGGTGLVAFRYPYGVITSTITAQKRSVVAYSTTGVTTEQSLLFIPEKCTSSTSATYCATPIHMDTGVFPDDWYKGVISYNDILWSMNIKDGSAKFLIDFLQESGREIDVDGIGTDTTGAYVYLINKNDNTLWLFDSTIQGPSTDNTTNN